MATLVVGDVHGCADELRALLASVRPDRVVMVGDLFTKGPDPVGVYDQVRDHEVVIGNHDDRLLQVLDGERRRDVHAQVVVASLDARDRGWRRWLGTRPLTVQAGPFTVVHAALHPSGDPAQTDRHTATYLRRYEHQARGLRWWADYRGETPVIFGHDAIRGLVRVERNGRPWVVGLDSGCVYGGFLSGYVVEEDRVVSVRARRVYRNPG
ncbi:MAG: metallophosphoesterase [Myxococcales bacterium]|nr:metallophosphoesterase [Myxococcales bacterium]